METAKQRPRAARRRVRRAATARRWRTLPFRPLRTTSLYPAQHQSARNPEVEADKDVGDHMMFIDGAMGTPFVRGDPAGLKEPRPAAEHDIGVLDPRWLEFLEWLGHCSWLGKLHCQRGASLPAQMLYSCTHCGKEHQTPKAHEQHLTVPLSAACTVPEQPLL